MVPKTENLLYLLEIAAVTRLLIGGLRVAQNSPSSYKTNDLTVFQKRKSFLERCFIELFGTGGYMIMLHFGQDMMSKLFEAQTSYAPPQMKTPLSEMTRPQMQKVNGIMLDVFGRDREGIISRVLYGVNKHDPVTGRIINQKATYSTLKDKLGNVFDADMMAKLEEKFLAPKVEPYVRKLYRASSVSVLAGVLGSALFGGIVIQWLNDNIFSPVCVPALVRMIYGKQDIAKGRENNPDYEQAPGRQGPNTPNTMTTGASPFALTPSAAPASPFQQPFQQVRPDWRAPS